MSKRVRLTSQTPSQAMMIVPLAMGVIFPVMLTVGLLSGEPIESRPDSFPAELYPVLYLALIAVAVVSWRSMTIALYSTRKTLTIRSMTRTRRLAWSDVADVRSIAGKGYGLPAGRFTLWLRLRTGEKVRLPIQRRTTPLQEAFLGYRSERSSLLLSHADYEDLLGDLRRYHKQARRAAARHAAIRRNADPAPTAAP
jgi:hypothetical protein